MESVEPLLYKEDWPETRERFLAFWEYEIVDRALIAVEYVPREGRVRPRMAKNAEVQVADIDFRLFLMNAMFQRYYYLGDALPSLDSTLGFAAFGGKPKFFADGWLGSVWIDPIIDDWETFSYEFDPQNKWLQLFLELKRREYQDSRGKYLPCMLGAMPAMDTLSFFRGANRLCMDLYDHPDEVKGTLRKLTDAFKWVNERRFEIIHASEEGSTSVVWAPGRCYILLCDFSCNIGPEHFREFVMPEIVELARWLDYSFYHLDGPNAIQHVPALLEIEELGGIQFVPGAANEHLPATHWLPLYRQIQAGGKRVQIFARYDEVESLLRELDPRGVFIRTSAPSYEAAEALLRSAGKWSCRGIHVVG